MTKQFRMRIRGFRRLQEADIVCAPLAIIASLNEKGKTSAIQAIQAAASGDAVGALAGEVKNIDDVAKLIHRGNKEAIAEIAGDGGISRMTWPARKLYQEGAHPPQASAFAAGQWSLPSMAPDERAKALVEFLKCFPSKDDLSTELGDNFSAEQIDELWGRLERDGWDVTQKTLEKNRATVAGRWEQATGERRWGKSKAQEWAPQGWRLELDDTDEEELKAQLAAQETRLEEVLADEAIAADRLAALEALVADWPNRVAALERATQARDAAEKALQEALAAQRNTRTAEDVEHVRECPHCKGLIVAHGDLVRFELRKYEPIPKKELERIQAAALAAREVVSARETERNRTLGPFRTAEDAWREAQDAEITLNAARGKTSTAETVATARELLERAKNDLRIFQQMATARKLVRQWEMLQQAIEVLAPDGLRQQALAGAIEKFNREELEPASRAAGWIAEDGGPGIVRIDPGDLRITYGDWPYGLLSESAQLKVRATLQVVQATMDGSDFVLIDRADLLDVLGRNQLFKLLTIYDLPAVVAMTWVNPARDPKKDHYAKGVPDLAKAGLGTTIWLEDGVSRPLAEVLAPTRAAAE